MRQETLTALAVESDRSEIAIKPPDGSARLRFENTIAALECGAGCLLFNSATAAVGALLHALSGDIHVVASDQMHGGSWCLLESQVGERSGELVSVDTTRPDAVSIAMTDTTNLVWIECPTGPGLDVSELSRVTVTVRRRGAISVVDNTAVTAIQQRPLLERADIVFYSTTAFLTGDPDDLMTAVVFSEGCPLVEAMEKHRADEASAPHEETCQRGCLGLTSLPIRARATADSAAAVAAFLVGHPAVSDVFYPGLPSHPGHSVARSQMKGYGPRVVFRVVAGSDRAALVAESTELFSHSASAGGPRSRIERLAASSGSEAPEDLIRLTIGLEANGDLLADLDRALRG